MEWVPEFNFQLSVKLGGGSIFQKACFLEIKEYALNNISQKASISDEKHKNRYMDDKFVFV